MMGRIRENWPTDTQGKRVEFIPASRRPTLPRRGCGPTLCLFKEQRRVLLPLEEERGQDIPAPLYADTADDRPEFEDEIVESWPTWKILLALAVFAALCFVALNVGLESVPNTGGR
jgi:hypothetical protein